MDSIAFALPIRAEMEERVRLLIEEFKSERGAAYDMSRRQVGLNALRLWFQQTPIKALVVYLESDDLDAYALNRALSGDPHDEWLEQRLEELTDGQLPLTELVVEWSKDEGHRQVESAPR